MGRRAQYRLLGRQLVGDKLRHIPHGLPFNRDHKVKASGDQIDAVHLGIIVDTLCDLVEAQTSLRRYLYLDQCRHLLGTGLIPVDQRMVSADDALFLHLCDFVGYGHFVRPQKNRQILQVHTAVAFNIR